MNYPTGKNVASLSLLYHSYYDRCSDGLHSLDPLAITHSVMFTVANHPHSLCVPLIRRKFHTNSFFLVALWNRFLRGCFPDNYNFALFKINWCLSVLYTFIICIYYLLLPYPLQSHSVTVYLEWQLGPCIR